MSEAPNYEAVEKVKKMRGIGMSFRDIARALNSDVKTVYRWHTYSLRKLSTGKVKKTVANVGR